jgi:hypothetical protein
MNTALREELLAMQAEDMRVREELLKEGALGGGYHPRMREVHERNAARLKEIIAASGWPGAALVGGDGSHAAWRIVQHSISDPPFQRLCLQAIRSAIEREEAPLAQFAFLEDRIRFFEGRPQVYGTQFHWDENGEMNPWPIEDAERVDERRADAGLNSIAERTREIREQSAREAEKPPENPAEEKTKFEVWLRENGWRD